MLTILGILMLFWLGSGTLMVIELNKTPFFRSYGKRARALETTDHRN